MDAQTHPTEEAMVKLEELRRRRAWSQERLAQQAGVSVRTVYNLERADRPYGRPQSRVILAISEALGVQPAEVDEFRQGLGLGPAGDAEGKAVRAAA
jgi:transcriptional regulator with XRE-family HTH domain